jgi:hypothetical protein
LGAVSDFRFLFEIENNFKDLLNGSHGCNTDFVSGLVFVLKLAALGTNSVQVLDRLDEGIEINRGIDVVSCKSVKDLRRIRINFLDDLF